MIKATAAVALLLVSTPVWAQAGEATVSANDPEGMLRALDAGGYTATLDTDDVGDPRIKLELAGFNSDILFYGCDDETHKDCDSVQFSAGFDREKPWDAQSALTISAKHRFAAVRLDDEGDPYITWDVITGKGIPTKVFLSSVQYFTQAIENAADLAFAKENSAEAVAESE